MPRRPTVPTDPVRPADPTAWVDLGAPDPFPAAALPPSDVAGALAHSAAWTGPRFQAGSGSTLALWELLATVAADDVAVARALEPVLDARGILAQAQDLPEHDGALPGHLTPSSSWGVYAAEGPGARLVAEPAGTGWVLDGVKPWCSLAAVVDGALVTAHLASGGRALFAVDLRHDGVQVADADAWVSRGLAEIPSTPVTFARVPATPVGPAGWYLQRPGFWWGGIGVAACWYGGAVGVARRVLAAARQAPESGAERLVGVVGLIDERLADARRALVEGAAAVEASADVGRRRSGGADVAGDIAVTDPAGRLVAKRVRASVAKACDDVLRHTAEALGPAPLTQEEPHAKRVADLAIYLRQHHPWREAVSLGRAVVEGEDSPW